MMKKCFDSITYIGKEIDDYDTFNRLPEFLKNFYKLQNGCVAFNGGLHFRGCVKNPIWHSLAQFWVGSMSLSNLFDSIMPSDIPFAQDCFGDQFLIRQNQIWKLSAEIDEINNLEMGFDEFCKPLADDPVSLLNIDGLVNITLYPGQLLSVFPPFCVKSETKSSLKPIDLVEQTNFLSNFSRHIKDRPDGNIVTFKPE